MSKVRDLSPLLFLGGHNTRKENSILIQAVLQVVFSYLGHWIFLVGYWIFKKKPEDSRVLQLPLEY